MAAWVLAAAGQPVRVYEKMRTFGRKLLVAGHRGLNLTHTGDLDDLLDRYGDARDLFARCLADFGPDELRAWAASMGIRTFVGSSGRVFPADFKAATLLRRWIGDLRRLGADLRVRHRWVGWDDEGALRVEPPDGPVDIVRPAATILALGGASWPHLGSDGGWVPILGERGVAITRLRPANCGFEVEWSPTLRDRFEGTPLKNVRLSAGGRSSRGECVVTAYGVEGGGVYELGRLLGDEIEARGSAILSIDLRPDRSVEEIAARLARPRGKQSWSNFLRKALRLSPVALALLREPGRGAIPDDPGELAGLVKAVPIRLSGIRPLAEAISTAGGLRLDEIDENLMLRNRPGVFVAGEMLDWEAPTGGYLLHGCLATGRAAARGVLEYLEGRSEP
jgi:uncharacterized flavoprotein (TIGR03862 family)